MNIFLFLGLIFESSAFSENIFDFTIEVFGLRGKSLVYEFEAPNDLVLPDVVENYFCNEKGLVELLTASVEKNQPDLPISSSYKKTKLFRQKKPCKKRNLIRISIMGTQKTNHYIYALVTFDKFIVPRDCSPYSKSPYDDKYFLLVKYSIEDHLVSSSRLFVLVA